jgi:hypothetical protein
MMMALSKQTILLLGNLKGKDHVEDLSVDGWIILEFVLGKKFERVWTG